MKKIIIISLIFILALSFTACSDKTDVSSGDDVSSLSEISSEVSSSETEISSAITSSERVSSQMISQNKPSSSSQQQISVDNTKYDGEYFTLRDGLTNSLKKLSREKKLSVAYLGGSITYGVGTTDVNTKSFRVLVNDWISKSFSGAEITEINAAIPSACSALGAYCIESDIIAHNPDLVFIEYALNDSYAGAKFSSADASAHMETIVRKILNANPACDIVFVYTTDSGRNMSTPLYETAAAHEKIAEHYKIMTVNAGWQLRKETGLATAGTNGQLSQRWLAYFSDSCHPTDRGNSKYAELIIKALTAAFKAGKDSGVTVIKQLPAAKNSNLYMNTRYIKTDSVDISGSVGWQKSSSQWSDFSQYSEGHIFTSAADNELTVNFEGTSFGILGPTNREVTYSVDGGAWQSVNFNSHPNPLVSGLANGKHTIKIKASGADSKTFAIAAFLIN